jgi:hypothetical protein
MCQSGEQIVRRALVELAVSRARDTSERIEELEDRG